MNLSIINYKDSYETTHFETKLKNTKKEKTANVDEVKRGFIVWWAQQDIRGLIYKKKFFNF